MLHQNITQSGITFSSEMNGVPIYFKEWSATDDCIYYLPLATLVDNGNAHFYKNVCTVPFDSIYLLDEDDRKLLGIPQPYDMEMQLRGDGMLNSPDFMYRLEYLHHAPGGDLLPVERIGSIIQHKGRKLLLSEKQYHLAQQVDAFNRRPKEEKNTDSNLRIFADIKALAQSSGCHLDSYLENENVLIPKRIKIELGHDDEGYIVQPTIDNEANADFQHKYQGYRNIQGVYPIDGKQGRIRVVLSPTQKENLQTIKRPRGIRMRKEEVEALVKSPTEFFDPDAFDLTELYSDRVIEIGIYQPKFYPFVCPYESCWIAGATIETPENGTTKVMIKDEAELLELTMAIEEAEATHKPFVPFKESLMGLQDARFLADTAKAQFNSPQKPVRKENEKRKVLIIEENAESTGFAVKERIIEKGGKYTLFSNPFLQEGFTLKEHQQEGVAWLQHLFKSKVSGCLMADDMGLGKTLQVLYFIDWHARNYPHHKPYLIVAPVSLLENWENEYARFFQHPRMKVTKLTSRDVPRQFNRQLVEQMQVKEVILTNYEALRNAQLNFCAVAFDIVVLDEAQKIKSPGTLVTNAAKALKGNFKIALTGTPVENSLLDLWCIMDFCVPGLLGNAKEFSKLYQTPLYNEDIDIEVFGQEIQRKMGIFFIRRLKTQVAKDMPQKIEMKQAVEMPALQESTYANVVNKHLRGIQPNMLKTILEIREVSEHPYLYLGSLHKYNSTELENTSARLQATINILDKIKVKNEKVILFAERKEVQKMLRLVCLQRYGIIASIINGDTPASPTKAHSGKRSRQTTIDAYQAQEGFNAIIMSPIAAGMGLNVTAANHVVHYSRHWNPAKENQATDRAYRIGQIKDVYVYFPLAVSEHYKSFDVTLDELLSRKSSLAASTIIPTERVEVTPDELGQILFHR